jgi:hypothetical protein
MVLFAIPTAVALLQGTGIFGCGWPRSSMVSLKIIPSWQYRNNAPCLALAADSTTNHKIEHSVWKTPLNLMDFPLIGKDPMKKWPHAVLRAFGLLKYDVSKWMFITMFDARYHTVSSWCITKSLSTWYAFSKVCSVPFVCLLAIVLNAINSVILTARA